MKKYKTLLFDVDDTLLDFGATEHQALTALFENHAIKLTPERKAHYKEINRELWKSFEEGKITRDEIVNSRFSNLFQSYGKEVDGVQVGENYRTYLEQGHHLMEGAVELITELQHHYELYIVTNGVSQTQYKRLKDSGLFPMFKGIFVSEDTGYQKPMKEFFDYVFDHIPNVDRGSTLIIGDSFNADIIGGHMAGIDTCWINSTGEIAQSDVLPTYEVKKLDELYSILLD